MAVGQKVARLINEFKASPLVLQTQSDNDVHHEGNKAIKEKIKKSVKSMEGVVQCMANLYVYRGTCSEIYKVDT